MKPHVMDATGGAARQDMPQQKGAVMAEENKDSTGALAMQPSAPVSAAAQISDATRLRMWRAGALHAALQDAHPEDADQIVAAWLHERMGHGPRTALLDLALSQITADADMWADVSPRIEIAAYVRAGLKMLAGSALAPAMRRQLFAALWQGMSADDKRAFIERVAR